MTVPSTEACELTRHTQTPTRFFEDFPGSKVNRVGNIPHWNRLATKNRGLPAEKMEFWHPMIWAESVLVYFLGNVIFSFKKLGLPMWLWQ